MFIVLQFVHLIIVATPFIKSTFLAQPEQLITP